jgi:hypothetical protein
MKRTLLVVLGLALCASVASAADNYGCYKAKDLKMPQFAATTASLSDEILVNPAPVIKKPFLYCAPSSLNGGAISDPATKLTCYKIAKGAKGADATRTVVNSLGTTKLNVKAKVFTYCVPGTAS